MMKGVKMADVIYALLLGAMVVLAILTARQRGYIEGLKAGDEVMQVQHVTIEKQSAVLEEQKELIDRIEKQRDEALQLCR